MMNDAQPLQALRNSCLRDRAIAGMARKNNVHREYEQNTRRKQQAYLPSAGFGGVGKCSAASRGSRQQSRSGSGRTRVGPGWDDTLTIVRDKSLDRPIVSIDSNDRRGMRGERCLRRECTGTRSEGAMTNSLQAPWSDSLCASRDIPGGGDGVSLSPPIWTVRSQTHRQHPQQHSGLFGLLQSRSPKYAEPTTATPTPSGGAGGGTGGGDGGGVYTTTSQPSTKTVSLVDTGNSPLPGVCYIRYPPTPDLAAVLHPSSSSAPRENGLDAPCMAAACNNKGTRLARCRRGNPPTDSPREAEAEGGGQEGEGGGRQPECGAGEGGSRLIEFAQYQAERVELSAVDSPRAGGRRKEEEDAPPGELGFDDPRGNEGNGGLEDDDAASAGESRVVPGTEITVEKISNQEEDKPANEPGQQPEPPRRRSEGKNECSRASEELYSKPQVPDSASPPAVAAGLGEERRRHRVGRGRRGEARQRQDAAARTTSNRILSMMTKDGHPLVASKAFPTLPGVDEYQRPPFMLAQMHDNMRKDRQAYRPNFGHSRDLEAAFRASRRVDAFMAIEKKGKAAFSKCLAMLEAHGLTPEAWLEELLSKRKGDSLTTFDMGESIRAYNRAKPSWVRSHKQWLRSYMISEKDLRWCQRFVDPDGNTDVDEAELSNAVRSTLDGKPRLSWEESRAVALILEFEKFISVNRIRLVDLFETVDKDKGGTIDGDELREFVKLGRAASNGVEMARTKERKEKLEEEEREQKKAEFTRKVLDAKQRHARSRETGVYDLLDSLKKFTKTKGLRLSDMIQATGAHPDEGMDPSQLQAFFERATDSSLHLTKESLEKIVKNVDEDGDGLLSLSEIQLALTQHTLDELLLRRLAKAVARHVSRREKAERKNCSRSRRVPGSPSGGLGAGSSLGSRGRHLYDGVASNDGGRGGFSENQEGSGSLTSSSASSVNRPRGAQRSYGVVGGDEESSEITLPTGATDVAGSSLAGSSITGGGNWPRRSSNGGGGDDDALDTSPGFDASTAAGLGGASTNVEDNYNWILDVDSSIDGISSMDGIELSMSAGERRAAYHMASSVPRTAFKVQLIETTTPALVVKKKPVVDVGAARHREALRRAKVLSAIDPTTLEIRSGEVYKDFTAESRQACLEMKKPVPEAWSPDAAKLSEAAAAAAIRPGGLGVGPRVPLVDVYGIFRVLNLTQRSITTIDSAFAHFTNLADLDLGRNRLQSLGHFPEGLVLSPLSERLRHLFLAGNPICLLPAYRERVLSGSCGPGLLVLDDLPVSAGERGLLTAAATTAAIVTHASVNRGPELCYDRTGAKGVGAIGGNDDDELGEAESRPPSRWGEIEFHIPSNTGDGSITTGAGIFPWTQEVTPPEAGTSLRQRPPQPSEEKSAEQPGSAPAELQPGEDRPVDGDELVRGEDVKPWYTVISVPPSKAVRDGVCFRGLCVLLFVVEEEEEQKQQVDVVAVDEQGQDGMPGGGTSMRVEEAALEGRYSDNGGGSASKEAPPGQGGEESHGIVGDVPAGGANRAPIRQRRLVGRGYLPLSAFLDAAWMNREQQRLGQARRGVDRTATASEGHPAEHYTGQGAGDSVNNGGAGGVTISGTCDLMLEPWVVETLKQGVAQRKREREARKEAARAEAEANAANDPKGKQAKAAAAAAATNSQNEEEEEEEEIGPSPSVSAKLEVTLNSEAALLAFTSSRGVADATKTAAALAEAW
eukprot:g3365.t1